jgi:hypothetical protein
MGPLTKDPDPSWTTSVKLSERAQRMRARVGYKSLAEFCAEDLPFLIGLFTLTSGAEKEHAVRYFEKKYGEV